MDITKAPITSKLMILRAGCSNFRTVGDAQEVNFSTPSNNLIIGKDNGAGKSTLYLFLPYYMLTGKSYKQGDTVDSLINSDRFKKMTGFLEFHFAGTYYRVERGRKPSRFDIMSLVDGEWVEIPNLPVSAKDRQGFLYSLMGMERSSAEKLIENTFLLGVRRFSGFLNMSTDDRRKLVEPIFDLTMFSQMNLEVKSLRSGKTIEQKQTGLEITDLNTKVALAEQNLNHIKMKKGETEVRYVASKGTLNTSLIDCQVSLEKASQLDTEGVNLKEVCTGKVKDLMSENTDLEVQLTRDVDALGEFKIDENDSVLVKLGKDLISVDEEVTKAKEVVAKKKESLGNEVELLVAETKNVMESDEERYQVDKELHEGTKYVDSAKATLSILKDGLETNLGLLPTLKDEVKVATENLIIKEKCVEEAEALRVKYQENITKLNDVAISITTKIEIEEQNKANLLHAGSCPACLQEVSTEWIEKLKTSIQEKIDTLVKEKEVYSDRASKGSIKVEELNLLTLSLELGDARMKKEDACLLLGDTTILIKQQENDISITVSEIDKLEFARKSTLGDLESQYTKRKQANQTIIDRAEDKATQALGEELANLKALEASAPQRVANLHQQVEDRKGILELDWGASKRSLQSSYKLAVDNISEKITMLQNKLEEDLAELVRYKESEVSRNQGYVDSKQKEIDLLAKNFNDDMNNIESELAKAYKDYKGNISKLEELNVLHDLQQKDIEDYDNLLILLSDNVGKAEVIENYIPTLNQSINTYLSDMGFYSTVSMDSSFKMEMVDEGRRGQTLYSLSEGETAKVNLAVMLSLRDIAQSKSTTDCNVLILDECLENLHLGGVQQTVEMLKNKFQGLSLNVISQRNDEMDELFDETRLYGKVGGFTKLIEE